MYKIGFGRLARIGSCALCCMVIDDKLFVANLGDCKGILISKDKVIDINE